jgi:hypothetical protein
MLTEVILKLTVSESKKKQKWVGDGKIRGNENRKGRRKEVRKKGREKEGKQRRQKGRNTTNICHLLTSIRRMIAVYYDNHMKPINTVCG